MTALNSTTSATPRRLPGIAFEMRRPPLSDILPRMDVAVFVGFATHGPLNTPFAVEDETQFVTVFGEDVLLAWDTQQGTPVYAYLAPAVRSFFRNGGKRCWVIRVAGPLATYNYFPISGLVRVKLDQDGKVVDMTPAFAHACSEGSWSDGLSTSTMLSALPITIYLSSAPELPLANRFVITMTPHPSSDVIVGDLLRLTYSGGMQDEYIQMVVVDAVSNYEATRTRPQSGKLVDVTCRSVLWLRKPAPGSVSPPSSPPVAQEAFIYHCGYKEDGASLLPQMQVSSTSCQVLSSPAPDDPNDSQSISLVMIPPANDAPAPGVVLSLRDENTGEQLWATVQEVHETHDGSPADVKVQVVGDGLWVLPEAPSLPPGCAVKGEQLSFSLWTRQLDGTVQQIDALTFDMRHLTCWNALAIDAQFYRSADKIYDPVHQDLWQKAAVFPLAGNYDEDELYIPIGMPTYFPDYVLSVDQKPGEPGQKPALPLERDGLSVFDASLFLDQGLIFASIGELLDQADLLLAQNDYARLLNGIYAALYINEVTLIAVPDAIHRGWVQIQGDAGNQPVLKPLSRSHAQRQGPFHDCVQSDVPPLLTVQTGIQNQWRLKTVAEYDAENLLTIQRALLRMCAARGDLFAVLSLPAHYYLDEAEAHVETLKQNGALTRAQDMVKLFPQNDELPPVGFSEKPFPSALPLNYGERVAFTYGALYHPWLIFSEEGQGGVLHTIPPEGAICGTIAQVSLDPRAGAWIAPANQPLSGVVALTPRIDQLYYERMMDAQVNIVRDGARGTLVLGQDTLCDENDADFRPINVRRLMMLLRRLALSLGPTYVFEPNSTVFRRSVQRSFEALLNDMFMRGAFAGDTPAASFQVVCDDTINRPDSVEAGNFVVELRVAPSLPMTFLTIRLVQSGTGSIIMES